MVTGITTPSGIGSGSEVLISARMRNLTRGAFRQIRKDMRSTSSASRNLVSGGLNFVNSALGTLRTLAFAGAAGIGALAAAFGTAQIRAASHAKQIQNIADTYGVTTVEVQALTNIVRRAGIEGANVRDLFEGVTDALIKVRAGGENIERALALTGITRGQFLSADVVQRIELIANGLESIEDPGLRAAVAADLAEDSFQRYNSVLSRIARGSLPTVIRQETELSGVVLPEQNRRLTENQVSWRLLADRFLTFRQNVAANFAPAANLILRHLREWVAQIEGPVSMAVAGLNTDVTNFLATSEISDHLAFELGIDPNEPSPAESFLDEIKAEVDTVIKSIGKVVQPLINYLDYYFLGVDPSSAQSQYLLSIGVDAAIPERSLKTQLGNIVVGVWELFASLFGDDSPEKTRAERAITGALTAVFEATLVLLLRRLTDPDFWNKIVDVLWDGLIAAVTAQNVIQERSNSFADKLKAAIELLFSLAAAVLIGRRFNFNFLGKLVIAGIINTLVSTFGEDEEGKRSVADAMLGWFTAIFLLIFFGGIAKALVSRIILSIATSAVLANAVASSAIAAKLLFWFRLAFALMFPASLIYDFIKFMVTRLITSVVSAITATAAGASKLIAVALRAIFKLAFGLIFVLGAAPGFLLLMVGRMITLIVSTITVGAAASAQVIFKALFLVFRLTFALLFVAGQIVTFVALMVGRMLLHITAAIAASAGVQLIFRALLAVMTSAFALLFVVGSPLVFVTAMVARMIGVITAAIAASKFAILVGGALIKVLVATFALIPALGFAVILTAITTFVAWLIFEIANAIGIADTNPVEDAISFFFNNILTNPRKIGAAIIAGWVYIGQTIAYGLGKVFESTINYIIGKINNFINLVNGIIRQLNRVPGVNIGYVGSLSGVNFGLTQPSRPRVDTSGNLYTRRNTLPNYNPTGNPNDYGPQPAPNLPGSTTPRQSLQFPGTIIIDGTSIKAVFTDWAYNEGLGTP